MVNHELLKKIPQEKMHKLGDYYLEMLSLMKTSHPDLYDDFSRKTYVLAYGYTLNEDWAEEIVTDMKPYGKHWTKEQTDAVAKQLGIVYDAELNSCTWYVVINMVYNDYHDVGGEDANVYAKLARNWVRDADSPYSANEKTYRYFTM